MCAHTLVPSMVLVSMTTMLILWSHIICQKSSTVPGTGAGQTNVSTYVLFLAQFLPVAIIAKAQCYKSMLHGCLNEYLVP